MKIAFLSPCPADRNYGGVQLSARLALEGLRTAASVRCLCYGPACGNAVTGGTSGTVQVCSHSKAMAAIEAIKQRNWPDCLVFWHADLLKLLPLIGARRRRRILFLHGVECWRKLDGAVARGLDQVDVFLSNSDFTWNRFIEVNPAWAGVPHRTVALGLGDPEPAPRNPAGNPAALMVGRMSRGEGYKGHDEVIRVWPKVLNTMPDAELWIVGGGDAAGDLQSAAAHSAARDRIRFFGLVSDAEKERLLRDARCLVLPSRGEGFGLVYLEAMRLGRPCLASTCDAGKEVVGAPESGMAVDPADQEQLADAIVRLMAGGGEWERLSANARRRYEAEFTAFDFQRRLVAAVTEAAV